MYIVEGIRETHKPCKTEKNIMLSFINVQHVVYLKCVMNN